MNFTCWMPVSKTLCDLAKPHSKRVVKLHMFFSYFGKLEVGEETAITVASPVAQIYKSGQIMATSRDLTPNEGFVREIPFFQGNLGW